MTTALLHVLRASPVLLALVLLATAGRTASRHAAGGGERRREAMDSVVGRAR